MSEVRMPEKDSLPSNSFSQTKPKPKTEKKRPAAVIEAPTRRKKSMAEESLTEVKSFIVDDIVLPRFKDMFIDILSGIFDMTQDAIVSAIFKTPMSSTRRGSRSRGGHVPYNSLYNGGRRSMRTRRKLDIDAEDDIIDDFRDVWIPNMKKRDRIEEDMYNLMEDQGYLTVGDVNYIFGIDSGSYTDEDYGWKSLSGMKFKAARGGGFYLDMPRERAL